MGHASLCGNIYSADKTGEREGHTTHCKEVIQSEALVNLLVKKGILTQEELITEVGRVKKKMIEDQETIRKMKH